MSFSKYATGELHENKRERECEKKICKDDGGAFSIQGTTDYKSIVSISNGELGALLQKLPPKVDLTRYEYRCLKISRKEKGNLISYYAPIIAVKAPWLQCPDQIRRFPIIRGTSTRTPPTETEDGTADAALRDLTEAFKRFANFNHAKDDLEIALSFNWSVDVTNLLE